MKNSPKEMLTAQSLERLHQFVEGHWQQKITDLAFKKELVKGWDNQFVLQQLYGKQKAKHKLPFLFNHYNSIYPPKISLEQCTSQSVALWKAKLLEGTSLLDMTGGFGIDTFFFSKKINQVTYIENQAALCQIVEHNFASLGVSNVQFMATDAVVFLKNTTVSFDWIYIDPARRDGMGNRKIQLEDYTPNLLTIYPTLLEKGQQILVKISPLLDITQVIRQLNNVVAVYVIALKNEVKELLVLMKKEVRNSEKIPIRCVNLGANVVDYIPSYQPSEVQYEYPKTYLYEPNAAILKAGLFKEVAGDFNLAKLHPNTHLYTADRWIENFPGRAFKVKAILPFQKKAILPYLQDKKANIAIRNFPYTVSQIKKKLGIKDGGNHYLFGTTLKDEGLKVLICEKLITKYS